jgi:C1A family cysteine protease
MKAKKITLVCLCALLMLVTILPLNLSGISASKMKDTVKSASETEDGVSGVESSAEETNLRQYIPVDEPEFGDPSTIPNYRVSGLLFDDMSKYEESRRSATAQPFPVAGSIPFSVANLAGLPPIGNQGSQGSCVGWALAYYCFTHQIAAANGYWDTAISSHQFSPAFVYNQINYGDDTGSYFADAANLLHDFGCATMDVMPYDQNDYITWPSESAYYESMKYQTDNTEWDLLYTNSDLDVLKSYLASGNTAVIGIYVRTAFYSFDESNNIYTTSHASGEYFGSHAVCVVGYDDSKATTDGPGAFLLVNSWGSGWGDSGFWWMSYEAIKSSALSQRVFYYCDVIAQPYNPSLFASIRVSHEKRGDVLNSGIGISLVQNGWTEWSRTFLLFNMADDSGSYQNYPFPGNHLFFDLSEVSLYLETQIENEFILSIGDSVWPVSGVLESFTITSSEWSIEATSSQTPHAILDNQAREEVSAILILPSVNIDTLDAYVGGTVEITGTAQGECEDTVLDVGFEPGSFATPWYTNDANSNNGDQLWGVDTYHSYSGGSSIWCGGVPTSTAVYTEHFIMPIWYWPAGWSLYSAGTNSHPWGPIGSSMNYKIACSTGGLSGVKEWAIQGPLDRSTATELCLTFWMDYEVQNAASNNFASVLYSTDGSVFTYLKRWYAPVGETRSFVGEQKVMLPDDAICSTLYFAFIFQGDYSGSMTVDDIDIWDIGSEYQNYADSYAYCYVDIGDFDSATMSFDYWADVESGFDWFSPGYYVGSTWITPYSLGTTTGWQHFTLPIPTDATRIGFLFHSDVSVVRQGVYVDNVQLIGYLDPISSVEIFVDDVSQGYTTCVGTWSYDWDTTSLTDGLHNITTSTNFGSSTISDKESTIVDNTAPVLSSNTESYQNGNNITICGYGNSLGGSWLVSLDFTSGDISQYFQNPLQGGYLNATTIYWWISNSTTIPDGHYLFQMRLADYAGNEHTISMELIVDNGNPTISHPPNVVYTVGTTGNVIQWDCVDLHPDYYELYRNGVLILTNPWTDGLDYSVDGLAVGTYTFTVIFYDLAGNSVTDSVLVTVNSSTSSTTDTTTTSTSGTAGTTTSTSTTTSATSTESPSSPLMSSVVVIAIAAGSAVIIVVVLVQIKRKR